MNIVMSLVGILTLLLIAFGLSNNRRAINWRTVGGAFAIQASLGAFVLYVPVGKDILGGISSAVSSVIGYANDGIGFLFGDLANFKVGFIFAINVLPVIVFFSSLIAVLYYLGVMQWIIRIIGGALQKALGTSQPESMSATANIFVGQTEAPLVVRPFIPTMTQSELFAIMVGGLASVAGSVLAGYAGLGVPLEYLIAASFMAAPGGLLMAKMMHPETEEPKQHMEDIGEAEDKPANVLDAAAAGASSGMQLALNVGAMLLAFIGLIALINGIIGWFGGLFGWGDAAVTQTFMALQQVAGSAPAFAEFANGLATQAELPVAEIGSWIAGVDRDVLINALNGLTLDDSQAGAVQAVLGAAQSNLTLELILGYIFAPLAFLMGVPWHEATVAGSFIGQKVVVNEFVAYVNFAPYLTGDLLINGAVMTDRTQAIIAFALCGFANLSSIAILLGGLGAMAPNRRHDLARLGMRAVVAGSLSNLMSATLAGLFLSL
ncbi:nucleoside transporter [Ferrimonas balearica DSM 9799]|uniref:Nucleoside transporter n=1 Tax=Ferrimonas balearica (strain DSM 9799 / CCM 4581 / KCTC 23876 / PAT) TaxID=550540 RepID=E1SSQ7_FERBD|nr:NupC/NupG family nucleoside CNT transporter [Ferrimonas balearica]ADN77061.1 nucleoside transporter [Ferrimonas balearica DSM 9799]MBY5980164.1 NupC/NupG family nucleoside CNT transporter [Ferrimonas balearica]